MNSQETVAFMSMAIHSAA